MPTIFKLKGLEGVGGQQRCSLVSREYVFVFFLKTFTCCGRKIGVVGEHMDMKDPMN